MQVSPGRRNVLLSFVTLLAGCSTFHTPPNSGARPTIDGPPAHAVDLAAIADAVPKIEPRSKYGNPPHYMVFGKRYETLTTSQGYVERGIASWYGSKFHAQRTSSGEPYDMLAMTAAHKTLPLPTYAEITHLQNGRKVIVKINDRGPFKDNRIVDLSYAAAAKLGITATGTGLVELRTIDPGAAPAPVMALQPGEPKLYLQVGAYAQRENAERARQRLRETAKEQSELAHIAPSGQNLYKVRIGPLGNTAAVDQLASFLESLGWTDPQVVVE